MLITSSTPSSLARRACSSLRSSRLGQALISSAVPVSARGAGWPPRPAPGGRGAPQDRAREVPDGVHVAAAHRRQHPLRQALAGLPEPGVEGGGDEVEAGQHLVRVVKRAVREDVQLHAGEEPDPGRASSTAAISRRCSPRRSRVSPRATPRLWEWSAMAMYSRPRRTPRGPSPPRCASRPTRWCACAGPPARPPAGSSGPDAR